MDLPTIASLGLVQARRAGANAHKYTSLILLNILKVLISKRHPFIAIQYGMLEKWKNGKMGLKAEKNPFFKNHRIPLNPLFQYPVIPIFQKGEAPNLIRVYSCSSVVSLILPPKTRRTFGFSLSSFLFSLFSFLFWPRGLKIPC
jgi:hypothetical protein